MKDAVTVTTKYPISTKQLEGVVLGARGGHGPCTRPFRTSASIHAMFVSNTITI